MNPRALFGVAAFVVAGALAFWFVRTRGTNRLPIQPRVNPIRGTGRAEGLRAQAFDIDGRPIPTEGIFLEPLDPSQLKREGLPVFPGDTGSVTALQRQVGQQHERNPNVRTLVGTMRIPPFLQGPLMAVSTAARRALERHKAELRSPQELAAEVRFQ